ncbi:hypothetical protein NXY56_005485 [Leishmania guyanensis]
MSSDTENSDFTDGDGLMSTPVSFLHTTQLSGAAARDRYASAPFLFQIRFSRATQPTELLVVDSPPPPSQSHIRHQLVPQRLQLGKHGLNNAAVQSGMPAAVGSARQGELKPGMRRVATHQTHFAMVRQPPISSGDCTSDSDYLLGNTRESSLSYTWTDSYLDESPSATRTRWIQQQTFGPVLQSEGGSSTVSSVPRALCETEAAWGTILAHNADTRNSAADAVGPQWNGEGDRRGWNIRGGGRAGPQRVELTAAKAGENGPGRERHAGEESRFTVCPLGSHVTPVALGALAHVCSSGASACTSNTSTVIATVQQSCRAARIIPLEKTQKPPTAAAAVSAADSRALDSPDGKTGAALSPATSGRLQEASLSSVFLDMVPASRALSKGSRAGIAGTDNTQKSHPSPTKPSQRESHEMDDNFSEIGQSRGNLRASRCGPPRGRVLKAICED